MAEISIIIPVYNVRTYMAECLESIRQQIFQDYEIVIVDDGSDDGSGEICDEYAAKDNRIKVIHQQNAGQAKARNVGLDAASGNYIAFIDSDDIVPKNYLSRMYDVMQKENADMVTCQMDTFTSKPPDETYYEDYSVYSGEEACHRLYQYASDLWVSPCDKLYRSSLYDDLRFPTGTIHEDQAIIPLTLYRAGKVVVLKDVLYFYRDRSNSTMHKKFSMRRFADMDAIDSCIEFYEKAGKQELAEAAKMRREVVQSKLILQAISDGVYEEVPGEYKISESKALRILRKNATDEKFSYYLGKVHPELVRPYAYYLKLKKYFN